MTKSAHPSSSDAGEGLTVDGPSSASLPLAEAVIEAARAYRQAHKYGSAQDVAKTSVALRDAIARWDSIDRRTAKADPTR